MFRSQTEVSVFPSVISFLEAVALMLYLRLQTLLCAFTFLLYRLVRNAGKSRAGFAGGANQGKNS